MEANETPATYNGEVISGPVVRYTLEQKRVLLNWHPVFTGRCPMCEMPIVQTQPAEVNWHCKCGWDEGLRSQATPAKPTT